MIIQLTPDLIAVRLPDPQPEEFCFAVPVNMDYIGRVSEIAESEELADKVVEQTGETYIEEWRQPINLAGWEKVEFKNSQGQPVMIGGQYHKWQKKMSNLYLNYNARPNRRSFVIPSVFSATDSFDSLVQAYNLQPTDLVLKRSDV